MTLHDKLCVGAFLLTLVVLGVVMFRGAYNRAHPKRRPAQLTSWQDGRRG